MFPHSDTCGSKLICSSPQLFAAYRVLLRLPMPRHSPYALSSLNFMSFANHFFRLKCFCVFTLSYQYFYCTPLCYVVVIVTLMFPWNFNITRFAISPFVFYSVFKVQLCGFAAWWAQVGSNHRPRAYQARALACWAMSPCLVLAFSCSHGKALGFSGGDEEIRTLDPLLAGQVLSQLSYTPGYSQSLFTDPENRTTKSG